MTPSRAYPALDAALSAIASSPTHTLASLSVHAIKDRKVVYQQQFGHQFIDPESMDSDSIDSATINRV